MIHRRTSLGRGSVAALVALAALTAEATVIARVNLPTLTELSEAVVLARVVEVRASWDESNRMIFSQVTLDVGDALRGEVDSTLVLRVPGGTVDGYTAEMIGAPEFVQGDEVVVFLNRWPDGARKVAGYHQGLSVVERKADGTAILRSGVCDGMPLSALAGQLQR